MWVRDIGFGELDRALGYSEGYTSRLVSTRRRPRADTLLKLADALQVDLAWLTTGKGPMSSTDAPASSGTRAKTFRDLPGWVEAERIARSRWRKTPNYAWVEAGNLSSENPPRHITPEVVFGFASAWYNSASDDDLAAAEEREVREIMKQEDEEYERRLQAKKTAR